MPIYLPIAEQSFNLLYIIALGGFVGFLSGMLGVSGGFVVTPLLIFGGVSPAIAVGSQSTQLIAASVSGALSHWRLGNVDLRMAIIMQCGAVPGAVLGALIFGFLQKLGQIDFAISLLYLIFLGSIGFLMLIESARAWLRRRAHKTVRRPRLQHHIMLRSLPLKLRFPRSKIYISVISPITIGFLIGILVSIMGIGGGFLLVPAMIYLLGMPASAVVGTSNVQMLISTMIASFMHAWLNQSVDIVLALLLLVGSVFGATVGAKFTNKMRGEQARMLLAILVFGVAVKISFDLFIDPTFVYDIVDITK